MGRVISPNSRSVCEDGLLFTLLLLPVLFSPSFDAILGGFVPGTYGGGASPLSIAAVVRICD